MRAYWPRLLWLGLLMGKLWVDDGTFRDVGSRRKVARRALLRFFEMPTSPTWESDLVDRLGWSHRYDHALIEWVPKIDHDWNELNWARLRSEGLVVTGEGQDIAVQEQSAERWKRRVFTWTLRKVGTVVLVIIGSVVAIVIMRP